jgi:hypothetical protein
VETRFPYLGSTHAFRYLDPDRRIFSYVPVAIGASRLPRRRDHVRHALRLPLRRGTIGPLV